MRQSPYIFFTLAALPLIVFGCASSNVNPPMPQANTGYVDFYSQTDAELCWDVRKAGKSPEDFTTVFSDVKPVEGDVLRLAFPPGHYRLRVTFLNRVIKQPADAEVVVEKGRITPVRIALTEAGTTTVITKETTLGGTAAGQPGRRTRVSSEETVFYEIAATAQPSLAYRPREQMPYAR
jgi:hypothetical protein